MSAMKIKKGDMVKVIAGKDKNKEGKVLAVNNKDGKVLVEGINMLTKHTKPSAANQNGYKVSTIIRKGQLFPWKNNSVSLEACNFYSLKS